MDNPNSSTLSVLAQPPRNWHSPKNSGVESFSIPGIHKFPIAPPESLPVTVVAKMKGSHIVPREQLKRCSFSKLIFSFIFATDLSHQGSHSELCLGSTWPFPHLPAHFHILLFFSFRLSSHKPLLTRSKSMFASF